jgi:small subunit ribosomal protein S4e
MAKKGRSAHLKRISAYRALTVAKKTSTWLVRSGPGPHPHEDSIPLGVLVRDYLALSANSRETKFILNRGEVQVDGVKRKSANFPVGLMDTVSFPKLEKAYKVGIDAHERLTISEIAYADAGAKLCRIKVKKTLGKGKTSLGLHDGKTVHGDNNYKVGDSVKISLPGNKVERLLKLEPGAHCLIIQGKHAGKVCALKELRQVGNRKFEARVEADGTSFVTVKSCLFVVE